MLKSRARVFTRETKRALAVVVTTTLALVGLTGIASPSFAGTNVDVFYSGNTIGTAVPASTTVDRDVVPLPGAASVTGSRTGYTFGGWSLTSGGNAISGSSFAISSSASRLDLYAVWNTTVLYDTNGATSGTLTSAKTSDSYRFGQALELPAAGTLSRTGYAFGGWMAATFGTVRFTTYAAASSELGNPTLYACWIKTVSFNSNLGTVGTTPLNQIHIAGTTALRLPTVSEMTLRKPGYDFVGWSTTSTGPVVSNPGSYIPLVAQQTLFAIWKVQSSKANTRVFFSTGKSMLKASQKLLLRDLVDTLRNKSSITITVSASYPRTLSRSLGKARNSAVVDYLNSLGVVATYVRNNSPGKSSQTSAKMNNRVSLSATWANPN